MTRIVLSPPTTTLLIFSSFHSLPLRACTATPSLHSHRSHRICGNPPLWLQALVFPLRRHSLFLCHRRSASLTPHSRLAPECTLHFVAHHSHTLFVLVPPKCSRSTQRPLLACPARVQCHRHLRSCSGSSQWFRVRAPKHWITTTRASLTPCSPQHRSPRRCRSTVRCRALPPKAPGSSASQAHIRVRIANRAHRSSAAAPSLPPRPPRLAAPLLPQHCSLQSPAAEGTALICLAGTHSRPHRESFFVLTAAPQHRRCSPRSL